MQTGGRISTHMNSGQTHTPSVPVLNNLHSQLFAKQALVSVRRAVTNMYFETFHCGVLIAYHLDQLRCALLVWGLHAGKVPFDRVQKKEFGVA